MTVTPRTMARQITVSRQQSTERARLARVAPRTRLAYSTKTGDPVRVETIEEWEDYCFVCSRATDHVGEHGENERSEQRTTESMSKDGRIRWITHTSYVYSA